MVVEASNTLVWQAVLQSQLLVRQAKSLLLGAFTHANCRRVVHVESDAVSVNIHAIVADAHSQVLAVTGKTEGQDLLRGNTPFAAWC